VSGSLYAWRNVPLLRNLDEETEPCRLAASSHTFGKAFPCLKSGGCLVTVSNHVGCNARNVEYVEELVGPEGLHVL
jgi:hypothetical protein